MLFTGVGRGGGNPKYASLRKAFAIADQEADRKHRRARGDPQEWVQTANSQQPLCPAPLGSAIHLQQLPRKPALE